MQHNLYLYTIIATDTFCKFYLYTIQAHYVQLLSLYNNGNKHIL